MSKIFRRYEKMDYGKARRKEKQPKTTKWWLVQKRKR
jgi:hypothetical protein